MVGTVVLNRPLTQREGHILIGSCIIPLVGGWLVNEAYNAHPDWDPDGGKRGRHHRKRHAKIDNLFDPFLPLSAGRRLAQAIRGATLHVIDETRHVAPQDAPRAVADALALLLRR